MNFKSSSWLALMGPAFFAGSAQAESCANPSLDAALTANLPCVTVNGVKYSAQLSKAAMSDNSVAWSVALYNMDPGNACMSGSAYCASLDGTETTVNKLRFGNDTVVLNLKYLGTYDIGGTNRWVYQYVSHAAETATDPATPADPGPTTGSSGAKSFDVRVSYYGSYDDAMSKKDQIENNLRNLADGVYEVSNGAHKIGTVTLFTDAANADNTDVLWVNNCWPNANVGGRGFQGSRVEHCDIFPNGGSPIDFLTANAGVSGGYTIVHEWGHFFYGLLDEYQNESTPCTADDPGAPCANDTPVQNSVMNSHWNAVDGDLAWLNFSTAGNNSGPNNAQYRVKQASAWETLVRDPAQDPAGAAYPRKFYPELVNVAPAAGQTPSLEINTDAGKQAARSALSFAWKRGSDATARARSGSRDLGEFTAIPGEDFKSMTARRAARALPSQVVGTVRQVVIDHSAAVSATQLDDIKAAVQQMIDSAEVGDVIGVQAFSKDVTEIAPLTLIDSEQTRDSLIQALENLGGSPELPHLSDALMAAAKNLENSGTAGEFVSSIYLFANGYNVGGGLIASGTLEKAGIPLYIFHTGSTWSPGTLLGKLAEETEGAYYDAGDTQDLPDLLEEAERDSSPMVDVEVTVADVEINGSQDLPFYLDQDLGEIEVTLVYPGSADSFSLDALDMQGTVYPLDPGHFCGDVGEPARPGETAETYCFIEASGLPEGQWKLRLTGDSGGQPVFYSVSALPRENADTIAATVYGNDGETLELGKPLVVKASVGNALAITNLSVKGQVEDPDGNQISFDLADNGAAPDVEAGDGIYTASLDAPAEGDYAVTVWFDNLADSARYTNSGFAYAPSTNGQLPAAVSTPVGHKFTRSASTWVSVWEKALDYERVMDWLEVNSSGLLAAFNVQELGDLQGFQGVRFYPLSGAGIGYLDGALYLYDPADKQIKRLGTVAEYLPGATDAGF